MLPPSATISSSALIDRLLLGCRSCLHIGVETLSGKASPMNLNLIRIPPGVGPDNDDRKIAEEMVESVKVISSLLESVEKYRQSIVKSTGIQISDKEMIGLYFSWEGDVRDIIRGFYYLRDNNNEIPQAGAGKGWEIAQMIVDSRLDVTSFAMDSVKEYMQGLVESTGIQVSEEELLGLYFIWRRHKLDLTKGFYYLRKMSADDGNETTKTVDSSPASVDSDSPNLTNKRAQLGDCPDSSKGDSTNNNKRAKCSDLGFHAHQHPELCGSFGVPRTSLKKCTSLMSMPKDKISAEVKTRWVDLYKKYLQYFTVPESMLPTQSDIATSAVPDPVACVWLFEPNWHDQAYQELLSIRNMYSLLLEKEYSNSGGKRFKSTMGAEAHRKYVKELLNFIGSSRDEIGALTKEECYDRLMGITCVVAYHAQQDASVDYSGETQLGNWRDQTYERLQCLRKMYSCMLDDAYTYVYGGVSQSNQLMQYKKECSDFLKKSLDFLGNSRADIVFLSEDTCRTRLKDIERFVDDGDDFYMRRVYLVLREAGSFSSSHTQQESSSPNWRDLAYEKIQSIKDGFPLERYRFSNAVWSENPELHQSVEELSGCITSAVSFFSVSRHALTHLSGDGYAEILKDTTEVLERIEVLASHLQNVDPVEF